MTTDGPMPLRLAMWSGPRNVSTAFMRAWENRPDTIVVDEPFYAHYLAVTGLDHPGRDEIVAHHESDWQRVVERLLENPDSDIKAIGGALDDIAPVWARMRALDAEGVLAPGSDRTPELLQAVNTMVTARGGGISVAGWVAQGGMFDDGLSDVALGFLATFHREPQFRGNAGRAVIAERLDQYAQAAIATQQRDIFGAPPPVPRVPVQTVRVFHGTQAEFDGFDFDRTSGFGMHLSTSRETAEEFAGFERRPGRVIERTLTIRNALDIDRDLNDWSPLLVARWIDDAGLTSSQRQKGSLGELEGAVFAAAREAGPLGSPEGEAAARAALAQWLDARGHDAIRYTNRIEGRPVPTYIIWREPSAAPPAATAAPRPRAEAPPPAAAMPADVPPNVRAARAAADADAVRAPEQDVDRSLFLDAQREAAASDRLVPVENADGTTRMVPARQLLDEADDAETVAGEAAACLIGMTTGAAT